MVLFFGLAFRCPSPPGNFSAVGVTCSICCVTCSLTSKDDTCSDSCITCTVKTKRSLAVIIATCLLWNKGVTFSNYSVTFSLTKKKCCIICNNCYYTDSATKKYKNIPPQNHVAILFLHYPILLRTPFHCLTELSKNNPDRLDNYKDGLELKAIAADRMKQ